MSDGIKIGTHDTGFWDHGDPIQTNKKLGENIPLDQAIKLTEQNDGAELLISKKSDDGLKKYDVYSLTVKEGKSLTSIDILENVSFEKNLAKKLGGEDAIIASSQATASDPISYFDIKPDLGHNLDNIISRAEASVYNTLFAHNGDGSGIPTLPNGQLYINDRIRYEAEDVAFLNSLEKQPGVSAKLHEALKTDLVLYKENSKDINYNDKIFYEAKRANEILLKDHNPEEIKNYYQEVSNYFSKSGLSEEQKVKTIKDLSENIFQAHQNRSQTLADKQPDQYAREFLK